MHKNLQTDRKEKNMTQQRTAEEFNRLKALAQPLANYLRDNYHPHTAIIITNERAVIVEDVIGVPFLTED